VTSSSLRLDDQNVTSLSARVPVLLVADDDEDILAMVQFRLARSGFEVVVARDGEEALRLAREQHPDLAVLDWMMPKATGLRCCARFAPAPRPPGSPLCS